MATESDGTARTSGSEYSSSTETRKQGRSGGLLGRQKWALLIILILIAAVAGMFVWKKIAVDRTRAEVAAKAAEVIAAQNEAFLRLVTVPLVWAVRSEMIRGNYDQINQYLINFVREPNVNEVVLAKPDGVILLATNKRLEGTAVADSYPATVLQAEKTVVTSLDNRGFLAASPVMGISGKLGVIIVVYKPAAYSLE